MNIRSNVAALLVAFAVVLPTGTESAAAEKIDPQSKLTPDDEKFIKEAANGGLMEVELGKMAAQKAAKDRVREFGRRMTEDHGKANQELMQLAKTKNVDIPEKLEGKHKSTYDRLAKLSGDQFEREYIQVMVEDHQEDIKKFQQQADKGKDAELKKFAAKQLPILKKHLELARTTAQEIGALSERKR